MNWQNGVHAKEIMRARSRRFKSFQSNLVNKVVPELGKARSENVEIDFPMYKGNHRTS